MMDNECSNALKQFLTDERVAFQLTPQGIHRRNTAERAIRTAKNHFIAGLCTVNPKFPLYLWDKLLPQAELTMNMLRGSRMNPKLSAWDQVGGVYAYNSTSIGPPGTRVLVHEKPNHRGTWPPPTAKTHGTSDHPSNTTGAIKFGFGKPAANATQTHLVGFPTECACRHPPPATESAPASTTSRPPYSTPHQAPRSHRSPQVKLRHSKISSHSSRLHPTTRHPTFAFPPRHPTSARLLQPPIHRMRHV